LKPPKDVLGLGRHLVNELKLEDGVDTLGKWMAHHIAELIYNSEKERTAIKRLQARREAVDTILKIWEHRYTLPGECYPLAQYKDVLMVLSALRPNNDPFHTFWIRDKTTIDQYAASLFDNLTRIIIALLLMKVEKLPKFKKPNVNLVKGLNNSEKEVLVNLQRWSELFVPSPPKSSTTKMGKKERKVSHINLNEAASQLIDNISTTLIALQTELKNSVQSSTSNQTMRKQKNTRS
jgi:hypothetical protein